MNFQSTRVLDPLKVLIVNPLTPTSQLIAVDILSGKIFGGEQLIDLKLLVYANEITVAEAFKNELNKCAFSCQNSILISSDLPCVSDADVFCFLTNFSNPNYFDFELPLADEQFDSLYLIIKVADNLSRETVQPKKEDDFNGLSKKKIIDNANEPIKPKKRPIFVGDGLITIDILKSLSKELEPDLFFCPTALQGIAKCVLGDYLKVECKKINQIFVWAANDKIFYVDIQKPLIIDEEKKHSQCDEEYVGQDKLKSINFDHTEFSASWMKKEFIEKVMSYSVKNPYGNIYKAKQFSKTLREIWEFRFSDTESNIFLNVGVISDGSLETIKGYPYVLPVKINRDSWTVSKHFEEDTHLKSEIIRINKAVKDHHGKLIPYCKKFLKENVINQSFIPGAE